jgi:hypothetical protein
MRAATDGAKPDWYDQPADVETVAICRLTGARATEACRHARHAVDGYAVQAASHSSTPAATPEFERPMPPPEPTVYEDLFPVGSVPVETCWMHGAAAPEGTAIATPMVDTALQREPTAKSVLESGNGSKTVVRRVRGADGVLRTTATHVR